MFTRSCYTNYNSRDFFIRDDDIHVNSIFKIYIFWNWFEVAIFREKSHNLICRNKKLYKQMQRITLPVLKKWKKLSILYIIDLKK